MHAREQNGTARKPLVTAREGTDTNSEHAVTDRLGLVAARKRVVTFAFGVVAAYERAVTIAFGWVAVRERAVTIALRAVRDCKRDGGRSKARVRKLERMRTRSRARVRKLERIGVWLGGRVGIRFGVGPAGEAFAAGGDARGRRTFEVTPRIEALAATDALDVVDRDLCAHFNNALRSLLKKEHAFIVGLVVLRAEVRPHHGEFAYQAFDILSRCQHEGVAETCHERGCNGFRDGLPDFVKPALRSEAPAFGGALRIFEYDRNIDGHARNCATKRRTAQASNAAPQADSASAPESASETESAAASAAKSAPETESAAATASETAPAAASATASVAKSAPEIESAAASAPESAPVTE